MRHYTSVMLALSSILSVSAACFAVHAGEFHRIRKFGIYCFVLLALAGLNASTLYGIQPIWSKGRIDQRNDLVAETWNALSRVQVHEAKHGPPYMWGPGWRAANFETDYMTLDIDNSAETPIFRHRENTNDFTFLAYDVTSLAYALRVGGSAAIIGVGGGRDVLAAKLYGFRPIVGIEVNGAIVDLVTRKLSWFSGLKETSGFEIRKDEGRSYLASSREKFDVIQASMVDTWAATSAGAMALTENSLYTVEAWRIFYQHLNPGGLLTFTRWSLGADKVQTLRMFAVAWATLLTEGVSNPGNCLALIDSGRVATLLMSNQPLSAGDLGLLRAKIAANRFSPLFLPGAPDNWPALEKITHARRVDELSNLRFEGLDYSAVFDSSPFFFNSLRLRDLRFRELPAMLRASGGGGDGGNLRALIFILCFMLASIVLVLSAIVLPLTRWAESATRIDGAAASGLVYFLAIGLGFMLIEIAMMQQLSIFLGHPTYSLAVVLAGLILSSGIGSLASQRLRLRSNLPPRLFAFAAALILACYAATVLPFMHRFAGGPLWQRAAVCLVLVIPCGAVIGGCFPVGLRWMRQLGQEENLPWMWALNGAASVLASYAAILLSMEASITATAICAAVCYAIGGLALHWATANEGSPKSLCR